MIFLINLICILCIQAVNKAKVNNFKGSQFRKNNVLFLFAGMPLMILKEVVS